MRSWIAALPLVMAAVASLGVVRHDPQPYELVGKGDPIPGQPYLRYTTLDNLGRTITFYITEPGPETQPVPLVVYIQGSGSQSNFVKIEDGKTRGQNGHSTIADAAKGRARLVIVEKPGVEFLHQPERPGSAMGAPPEFLREHTLPRWAEAVAAAAKAARTLPAIDRSRTLVMGHSEGGLVACKVAADNTFITHVASLAGGGPTQLYDLAELTRQGVFGKNAPGDADERAESILAEWDRIKADPDSTDKFWLGHPYRRWSSFLATSPMEELTKTSARVFLAQGDADRAVTVSSFDVVRAHLITHNKDVTALRLPGAGHSLGVEGEKGRDGWKAVMGKVLDWYLSAAPDAGDAARAR